MNIHTAYIAFSGGSFNPSAFIIEMINIHSWQISYILSEESHQINKCLCIVASPTFSPTHMIINNEERKTEREGGELKSNLSGIG